MVCKGGIGMNVGKVAYAVSTKAPSNARIEKLMEKKKQKKLMKKGIKNV